MLFPQNADGETWGNDDYGLPVPTKKAGFEIVVPGYFQPRTNDYTAQITRLQIRAAATSSAASPMSTTSRPS